MDNWPEHRFLNKDELLEIVCGDQILACKYFSCEYRPGDTGEVVDLIHSQSGSTIYIVWKTGPYAPYADTRGLSYHVSFLNGSLALIVSKPDTSELWAEQMWAEISSENEG